MRFAGGLRIAEVIGQDIDDRPTTQMLWIQDGRTWLGADGVPQPWR